MYGIPESLLNNDMACARTDDEPFEPVSLTTPYGTVTGHPQAIEYLKALMDDDINSALEFR